MEDRTLTIIADDGREIICDILFTYYSEEFDKHYVVFMPQGTDECSAAEYIEQGEGAGQLKHIDNEEEWALLEDLLDDYNSRMDEEMGCGSCPHANNCNGECDQDNE